MGLISSNRSGPLHLMSIVSFVVRSQPTYLYRFRPNFPLSSTSRPPKRLASKCRRLCSPAPTRSSNDRAPRVHHATRRRGGGVADCGAGAAARGDAAYWRADGILRGETAIPLPHRHIHAGPSAIRLGDGRNVRIDVRWADGDVGRMRAFAKELTDFSPT